MAALVLLHCVIDSPEDSANNGEYRCNKEQRREREQESEKARRGKEINAHNQCPT